MNPKSVLAVVTIAFSVATVAVPIGVYASNGESLASGQRGVDPITGAPVHNNSIEGNPPLGQK